MKRLVDILLSCLCFLLCAPIVAIIALAVKFTSPGPILYWSERVGRNNVLFKMPKFRTMKEDTPALATRAMKESEKYLTPIGPFLRKTSLDEIPQFWSILKGDMSFVGPRPVLPHEEDLLALRTQQGVHTLIPGLTGWAQINGRDLMTITQKIAYEKEYITKKSFFFDIIIILKTIPKVLFKKDIVH